MSDLITQNIGVFAVWLVTEGPFVIGDGLVAFNLKRSQVIRPHHGTQSRAERGYCACAAHSFASLADEVSYTEATVGALLGHRSESVTRWYVHHVDRLLIAAADHVAGLIEAAMSGNVKQAEVLKFPTRTA